MSRVEIYLFKEGETTWSLEEVRNVSAWTDGFKRLMNLDQSYPRFEEFYYETFFKPAYNEFQKSSAPDWKKIAVGFLSDYTIILDEDRSEVVEALKKAYDAINDGKIDSTIGDVACALMKQDRGPIVILTSDICSETFPYASRVHIEDYKAALQKYKENPLQNEIEELLEDYIIEETVSVETAKKIFQLAVPVPRLWP